MIHAGDLFDVLPTLEAESIDACVTDPPYGIGFMGREWDTFKPSDIERRIRLHDRKTTTAPDQAHGRGVTSPSASASMVAGKDYDNSAAGLRRFQVFCEDWGREVFRVLKPGAYILSCGAPRSYHRMASGLEDAGFEIRDCLAWLFGSGFPKSLNIGDGLGTALKPAHEPIVLARKPFKGTVRENVATHGTGALNIDACRIATGEVDDYGRSAARADGTMNPGLQGYGEAQRAGHQQDVSDLGRWPANVALDDIAAIVLDEQSGELVSGITEGQRGTRPGGFANVGADRGDSRPNGPQYADTGGASRFYLVVDSRDSITYNRECEKAPGDTSVSLTAAGIGSGARRAAGASINSESTDGYGNEPTAAFLPDTRSTTETTTRATTSSKTSPLSRSRGTTTITSDSEKITPSSTASSSADVSDAESIALSQNLQNDRQEPTRATADDAKPPVSLNGESATESTTTPTCEPTAPPSVGADGDFARFYYVAKPSREERDMGCYDLPARTGGDATDRTDGSAGLNNPRAGAGRTGGARNIHPTVKPVELMRWLVKLVTPPGGTVIDPFLGSGTTGMACRYEQREFIGIEREAEYIEIAERRIAAVAPLFAESGAFSDIRCGDPHADAHTSGAAAREEDRDLFRE